MEEIISVLSVEGVKLSFQVAKLREVGDLRVWEKWVGCKQAQGLKPGTKRFTGIKFAKWCNRSVLTFDI